jgi:hypothetical protein
VSGGTEATFDVQSFRFTGGASLYVFILFHEVIAKPASEGLGRLARLVAEGRLSPCKASKPSGRRLETWRSVCSTAATREGRIACRGVVPAQRSGPLRR